MAEEHFRVVFDGPAVEDGEMDVSQLASSLLALGKLIEQSDLIRTGQAGRVNIRVRSDVRRGSFDVGISVHMLDAVLDWASTPGGGGLIALIGLSGINAVNISKTSYKGLIQVVRWLRGRRVSGRSIADGKTTLITEDGDKLSDVDPTVAKLAQDSGVRQSLERFTEPLREDGVDEIRFESSKGGACERIAADEAAAFAASGSAGPDSSSVFSATYQIKRLFFERGRKWRLSSGAHTIQAEIEDDVFWRQVDLSEISFRKGDFLVCVVRMDQWLSPAGLRAEYSVVRVQEHIVAPQPQENLL